jgi:hypothetical protein
MSQRILVVGHSYVSRYKRYLNCGNTDVAYRIGLPLESVFVVGRGGLKVNDSGLTFILEAVNRVQPNVVVLELGTNDLNITPRGLSNEKHAKDVEHRLKPSG